jgi:hypothetical protein
MGEQCDAVLDHGPGFRDNNGATAAVSDSMPLSAVVALQSHTSILTLEMVLDRLMIPIEAGRCSGMRLAIIPR